MKKSRALMLLALGAALSYAVSILGSILTYQPTRPTDPVALALVESLENNPGWQLYTPDLANCFTLQLPDADLVVGTSDDFNPYSFWAKTTREAINLDLHLSYNDRIYLRSLVLRRARELHAIHRAAEKARNEARREALPALLDNAKASKRERVLSPEEVLRRAATTTAEPPLKIETLHNRGTDATETLAK